MIAGSANVGPTWAVKKWGFAVCPGAMLIRSGPATCCIYITCVTPPSCNQCLFGLISFLLEKVTLKVITNCYIQHGYNGGSNMSKCVTFHMVMVCSLSLSVLE